MSWAHLPKCALVSRLRATLLTASVIQLERTSLLAIPRRSQLTYPSSQKWQAGKYDPRLPSVDVKTRDGRTLPRNFRANSKTDPTELAQSLYPLLNRPFDHATVTASFGTETWSLDADGDAILRCFAFDDFASMEKFRQSIDAMADKLNHHPGIWYAHTGGLPRLAWGMAVSCGTQRPPGLSSKDIELATAIDDLARPLHTMAISFSKDKPEGWPVFINRIRSASAGHLRRMRLEAKNAHQRKTTDSQLEARKRY